MSTSETAPTGPTIYCLGCSYVLDGLPENRCPECGRPFDPENPGTFGPLVRTKKSALVVALMYLVPLLLFLLFWAFLSTRQPWAGGTPALRGRLLVGLWQACGPLTWVIFFAGTPGMSAILVMFVASWALWLAVACRTTRLRSWPYSVHLTLSFLWCFAGCPAASLCVT